MGSDLTRTLTLGTNHHSGMRTGVVIATLLALLDAARTIEHPVGDVVYPLIHEIAEKIPGVEGDPEQVYQLLDQTLGRRLFMTRISHSMVKAHWSRAKRPVRLQFSDKVKGLIFKVFARLFLPTAEAKNIRLYPMVLTDDSETEIIVRGIVDQKGRGRMPLEFHLLRGGSRWRIVDIVIDEESIVETLRQLFTFHLQSGDLADLLTTFSV